MRFDPKKSRRGRFYRWCRRRRGVGVAAPRQQRTSTCTMMRVTFGLCPITVLAGGGSINLIKAGNLNCLRSSIFSNCTSGSGLGLGMEFHSEKIPRNRLGTVSVIPRKKVLIPRHSEFRGRANSEARNGTEQKNMTFAVDMDGLF
jgi:hypothetical protein